MDKTNSFLNQIDTIANEASEELSDWEIQFLANLHQRLLEGTPLTERQREKLDQIYKEKVG